MNLSEFNELINFIAIAYGIWLTYVTIWKDSNDNDAGFIGKCFVSIAIFSVGFGMISAIPGVAIIAVIILGGISVLNFISKLFK